VPSQARWRANIQGFSEVERGHAHPRRGGPGRRAAANTARELVHTTHLAASSSQDRTFLGVARDSAQPGTVAEGNAMRMRLAALGLLRDVRRSRGRTVPTALARVPRGWHRLLIDRASGWRMPGGELLRGGHRGVAGHTREQSARSEAAVLSHADLHAAESVVERRDGCRTNEPRYQQVDASSSPLLRVRRLFSRGFGGAV
jgi:hypothetical protein